MSSATRKTKQPKADLWSDAENFALLYQAALPQAKERPNYKSILMPGRTLRAVQHQWNKLKKRRKAMDETQAARDSDVEEGEAQETGKYTKGQIKFRVRKTDEEAVMPPKKKKKLDKLPLITPLFPSLDQNMKQETDESEEERNEAKLDDEESGEQYYDAPEVGHESEHEKEAAEQPAEADFEFDDEDDFEEIAAEDDDESEYED